MSGILWERIQSFIAAAAISKGQGLKLGTNEQEITPATAATDVVMGFARRDAVLKDTVGVYFLGGQGYALNGATAIAKGATCKIDTSGKIEATTTAGDWICAIALEAIPANGIGRVHIVRFKL